jgi:hypothetical protein
MSYENKYYILYWALITFIYVVSIIYQITNIFLNNHIKLGNIQLFYRKIINFISYHFELKHRTSLTLTISLATHYLHLFFCFFFLFLFSFFLHIYIKIKDIFVNALILYLYIKQIFIYLKIFIHTSFFFKKKSEEKIRYAQII